LFVYHPDKHNLEELFSKDIRDRLATAAFEQKPVAEAACDIIIAGSVKKLSSDYGNKAGRYMLLEAGHVAQNIQLQAVSLGLGSVPVGAFEIRDVSKVCRLPANLEPIYIICVGYPAGQATIETGEEEKEVSEVDRTQTKRAALIIASDRFRDEELFETQRAIAGAGVETVIASSKTGVIKGMRGGKAEATILVNELKVDDYDAIVFIGGSGAKEYFDSNVALNIARQAAQKGKVLAAICIAPTVLANAGLLQGVKATSFSSERVRLRKAGAQFTDAPVERDGLIITGKGPEAASEFGKAVADAITSG
jgi:protease I